MTTTAIHHLELDEENIYFQIKRTARRKTISISCDYQGVRALAPQDLDDKSIYKIISRKKRWILNKQAIFKRLVPSETSHEFISGETFYYLGRAYRLKIILDKKILVAKISSKGSWLIATIPYHSTNISHTDMVRMALKDWYCDRANTHFIYRTDLIAKKFDILPPELLIADQLKRWGSCNNQGKVRLNWRLVMAPTSLIDYVIAHEICHLQEQNHSTRFWRYLEIAIPDYRYRAQKLAMLGHLYAW